MSLKVSIFKLLQNRGVTLCFQNPLRDNTEIVDWYPDHVHEVFARDQVRNDAYAAAIAAVVDGRTVLEVGTGPGALLAGMCVAAGARRVHAVEANPVSFARAQVRVREAGWEDRIILHEGVSTDLDLDEQCDVLVHDIVGSIGSAEGMGRVVLDARARLLSDAPRFVPHACATLVCPVGALALGSLDGLLTRLAGGVPRPTAPGIYKVFNFPRDLLVAEPAELERMVFDEPIELAEERELTCVASRDAAVAGLLFFIQLAVSPDVVIDSLALKTNWSTPYLRLFDEPAPVAAGQTITIRTDRDVSTTTPRYAVEVTVGGRTESHSWTGF